MRTARAAAAVLFLGVAACATPGQVRRVETAVAAANSDRARSDSAQRSELARIQIAQRRNLDSINLMFGQLNDAVQRLSRENSSNFDELRRSLFQVANATSSMGSTVKRLTNQVETAVSSTPVPAGSDTTTRSNVPGVPQPDVLIEQARNFIQQSANSSARRSLNQLLTSYPQAPQVPDAIYWIGSSFEVEQPDSARAYYSRVFTTYPKAVKAPTALYKLAGVELKAGNVAAARKYWQTIVDKYADSNEAPSARDRLRENP